MPYTQGGSAGFVSWTSLGYGHAAVISGPFGMSIADAFNRGGGTVCADSFVHIPARMVQFTWAREATVVQIKGTGSFDMVCVNTADDPRTKKR